MGSTESTARKVSFGMDEEERVRVLQGIRLSEDVVNRMKDSSASSRVQQPSPASPPPTSTSTSPPAASPAHASSPPPSLSHASSFAFGSSEGKSKRPRTDPKPPKAESQSSRQPSEAEEDLYRRYEQEQAMVQEELLQLAKREREVAREHLKSSLPREKSGTNQEKQRSAQLHADLDVWAKELEGVEAELRRRDIFYREQLGRIERKNAEMYKLSSQQFHEAATRLEETINQRISHPVIEGKLGKITSKRPSSEEWNNRITKKNRESYIETPHPPQQWEVEVTADAIFNTVAHYLEETDSLKKQRKGKDPE
ncbi:MICOS complex subunit MIC25 isoform X2 [Monodelphis domestica]|uniref:MICOS complex subunit MIC25 isoform X2 n=1 Tax=Monodelphis domestica TaxID=13616 RepID=UPI0024E24D55|nr:MICOS complex subunit MIC25 isoform X2 [Monodelphis domestica]